jgi:hypothetical protein
VVFVFVETPFKTSPPRGGGGGPPIEKSRALLSEGHNQGAGNNVNKRAVNSFLSAASTVLVYSCVMCCRAFPVF